MLEYTYLLSQFPTIDLFSPPKITIEYFEEQCRIWLSDNELQILFDASNLKKQKLKIVKLWNEKDDVIRSAVAVARLLRNNMEEEAEKYRQGILCVYIADTVTELLKNKDPLSTEYGIAKLRYELLDEIAKTEPEYSFAAIYIYHEKLKIAMRFAKMTKELGEKTIQEVLKYSAENLSNINFKENIT